MEKGYGIIQSTGSGTGIITPVETIYKTNTNQVQQLPPIKRVMKQHTGGFNKTKIAIDEDIYRMLQDVQLETALGR